MKAPNLTGPRHSFEEHTGEVRLEVFAPTRETLLSESGRALAELLLGEVPEPPKDAAPTTIEIRARDRGALVVEWLNELVFQSEVSKQVFTRFEVERADDTSAKALAWGTHPETIKTAVKAATLHDAKVELRPTGWFASVVLDV